MVRSHTQSKRLRLHSVVKEAISGAVTLVFRLEVVDGVRRLLNLKMELRHPCFLSIAAL